MANQKPTPGGLLVLLLLVTWWAVFWLYPRVVESERADVREFEAELSLYCEMVEIRRNSGDPNLGWPDYKGVYDAECN